MRITMQLGPLVPVIVPALGVIAILLIDALAPRLGRAHWLLTAFILFAAAGLSFPHVLPGSTGVRRSLCIEGTCTYSVDHISTGLQILVLGFAGVVALLAWPSRVAAERIPVQASLVLASAAGSAGVVAARGLGSWLVMLELATLPTIGLVALRARRSSLEGALQLLVSAMLSFALVAMGAALWLAATGSPLMDGDAVLRAAGDPDQRKLLLLAVAFIIAGLGFKLTFVPFHGWAPEAYDGASVPVAAYLAVVSKFAALGALLVVWRALVLLGNTAMAGLGIIAVISMTLGNLLALREPRTLRFLAWSTIAQAGWVVIPLATNSSSATKAAAGYLIVYGAASMLVFAVVATVAHSAGRDAAMRISSYAGLVRTRPLLGVSLGVGLLTLAGLPPAVLGVVAKVLVLRAVASDNAWWLAVIAAVNAMIGVAVYLRWVRILLTADGEPTIPAERRSDPVQLAVVGIGVVLVLATSVAPSLLLRFVS